MLPTCSGGYILEGNHICRHSVPTPKLSTAKSIKLRKFVLKIRSRTLVIWIGFYYIREHYVKIDCSRFSCFEVTTIQQNISRSSLQSKLIGHLRFGQMLVNNKDVSEFDRFGAIQIE